MIYKKHTSLLSAKIGTDSSNYVNRYTLWPSSFICGCIAKKPLPSKYYTDKKRAVMSTWLQLKQRIKNNQLNLEDAQRLAIPFVLCEALEADVYVLRLIDDSWTAVEEVKDIDIPSSISNIKDGEISRLLDRLSAFKAITEVSNASQKRKTSMQRIYNKQPTVDKLLKQSLWKDTFEDEE